MANTLESYVPELSASIGTATGASHAETCNAQLGLITTESLSTASGATETRTLTNSYIQTGSILITWIQGGTNTTVIGVTTMVSALAAGSATIKISNISGSALNGTVVYGFLVL